MGGESEDWKQKREAEHKKSFEEGKGMSGIILEQIGEVWNGNWRGKPKASGEDQDGRETPEKK
jgi:hypothetical protein